MKTTLTFLFALLFSTGIMAQDEARQHIDKGIELYDKGEYKAAVEEYQKALSIDATSSVANYEIASTYFAMKEYKKSIEHIDKVIAAKTGFIDKAYVLKGSALDMLGKSSEAIRIYKEGIAVSPVSYLLHYNLAFTLYNEKQYEEAEINLQKALEIKSSHASSHLLLGFVMADQGKRVQSLLALYNFLLLEPKSDRAAQAYTLLQNQLKKGVKKDSDKATTITLNLGDEKDEFGGAEMMISLLEASKNIDENKNKTGAQLFAENTASLFTMLGEMKEKNNSFWWNYYVEFFDALTKVDHDEAFAYYISQSGGDAEVDKWVKNNQEKIQAFAKWYSDCERKF